MDADTVIAASHLAGLMSAMALPILLLFWGAEKVNRPEQYWMM